MKKYIILLLFISGCVIEEEKNFKPYTIELYSDGEIIRKWESIKAIRIQEDYPNTRFIDKDGKTVNIYTNIIVTEK